MKLAGRPIFWWLPASVIVGGVSENRLEHLFFFSMGCLFSLSLLFNFNMQFCLCRETNNTPTLKMCAPTPCLFPNTDTGFSSLGMQKQGDELQQTSSATLLGGSGWLWAAWSIVCGSTDSLSDIKQCQSGFLGHSFLMWETCRFDAAQEDFAGI